MKENDLIQAERNRMSMHIAHLENLLKAERKNNLFLQNELERVNREFDEQLQERIREVEYNALQDRDRANKAERELAKSKEEITDLKHQLDILKDIAKVAKEAEKLNFDHRAVISLIQKHIYGRSSETTRFLNDVIDPDNPALNDADLSDLARLYLNERKEETSGEASVKGGKTASKCSSGAKPKSKTATPMTGFSSRKRVYGYGNQESLPC